MNILAITAYHPPYHLGGYELRCKNVLDSLAGRGHAITVVTNAPPDHASNEVEGNVYRVLHVTRSKNLTAQVIGDIQDLRWINRLIRQKKVDVLYLWHTIVLSPTIFPFIAALNLPIVYDEGGLGLSHAWTKHGDWINYCDRKRTSRVKETLKQAVCLSTRAFSGGILPIHWRWPENMGVYFNSRAGLEAARGLGVPVNAARVIYSGLQLENFPFRDSVAFSEKRIRLLLPGRIARVKAIDLAIGVLAALKRKAPQRQFELAIAGSASDEIYFRELQGLIRQLGVQGSVQFFEHLQYEEMASIYHSAEFCLFPSRQKEGLSRVPLEAMACGSLVFSAGNEGSNEIIENGATGYILPFDRPDDVADRIVGLIENIPAYSNVVTRARKRVEESFSLEKSVDQVEQILINAAQVLP